MTENKIAKTAEKVEQKDKANIASGNGEIRGGIKFKKPQKIVTVATNFGKHDGVSKIELKAKKPLESIEQKFKTGKPISLKEFFNLPKGLSPVVDAYHESVKKETKDQGKSQTLEQSVHRLQNVPWASDIKIVFNKKGSRRDFDPNTNTIEIGGHLCNPKEIETFVHEAYHATHRGYFRLYIDPALNNLPASKDTFMKVRFGDEVRAFEEEIKINNELTGSMVSGKPITMAVVEKNITTTPLSIPEPDREQINRPNLNELYSNEGLSGLWKFLKSGKPAAMTPDNKPIRKGKQGFKSHKPYGKLYEDQYHNWYQESFEHEISKAQEVLVDFMKKGHSIKDFSDREI